MTESHPLNETLEPDSSKFPLKGLLDTLYPPEQLEHIPLISITKRAQEKLEKWGFSKKAIHTLQEFCRSFRYGDVEKKLELIASRPSQVFFQDDKWKVTLPVPADKMGSFAGDCGDIAIQVETQAEIHHLMEELQLSLSPEITLNIDCVEGQSKTHFCHPESNHVWNRLVVEKNGQEVDSLIIDCSFQIVTTPEESRYVQVRPLLESDEVELLVAKNIVPIAYVSNDKSLDDWEFLGSYSAVLGLSKNKSYCYSLGFTSAINANQISRVHPVIVRTYKDSSVEAFMLDPYTKKLSTRLQDGSFIKIAIPDQVEVEDLLYVAERITFQFTAPEEAEDLGYQHPIFDRKRPWTDSD